MSCMHFFWSVAVTDFSFVSSVVGVPFATNVNALTVTRCESADRYVSLFSACLFWWYEWRLLPQLQPVSSDHQRLWVVHLQQSVQWYSSSLLQWNKLVSGWSSLTTWPAFPNKEWNVHYVFEMHVTYNMNTLFYMSCIPKKD